MPFIVIKGTFHVVGFSPDGDSIRFKALDQASWGALEGIPVRLNAKGMAQLRIEAIDTLETHFENQHQPLVFAEAAAQKLFAFLGIKDVVWNAAHSRVVAAKDGVKGAILARTTEENGRPVAFVFDATLSLPDGQPVFLEKPLVRKSINFKMLRAGLAYPTFYDGLFYDLRELFARETMRVRKSGRGLWASDATNGSLQIGGLADVAGSLVLLPKLFRRIVDFIKQSGGFDPLEFIKFLDKGNEKVLILSRLHFTHLDNLLTLDATGKLTLTEKPEDLVFLA
jgi:hypothetical protein